MGAAFARFAGIIPLRALRLLAATILLLVGAGTEAWAEGVTGSLEWEYNRLDTVTEDNAGQRTESKSNGFLQRYLLALDRRIYPNLNLYASGLFERNAVTTETDGAETDSTLRRLRPLAELRLRTPLYIAEISYRRNEQKREASGASPATDIQDAYFSSLQWRPDGFPHLGFRYSVNRNYDRARLFRDTAENEFLATAEYQPVTPLFLRYEGRLRKTDNRLEDIEIRQTAHAMRASYGDSWWKGLMTVSTEYDFNRRETEVTAAGSGEVTFPVLSLEGLSAIDDTPEEGALDPNPALVDGNTVAGAGINIGLPPTGGDIRLRNAGLRFDVGSEVNILFLWVDRELPQDIAGSFSWRVYSSDDNRNWELVGTPAPAVFDPFLNRFEIRFPNVTKRFVKTVVAPLSPTVPGATGFPTILVTELQAAVRRPAQEAAGKQVQTTQRYTLDVRTRLLQVPAVYYEFFYYFRKPDPGESSWTLSNGLSAIHRFSRILSGAARVGRDDGRELGKDLVAYRYTASLTAVPLETLRHTLVFSGLDETVGESWQKSHSLVLQNIAQLYQGVDVTLGGGVISQSNDTGEELLTTTLNGLVTLVPNRRITVNLIYNDRTTDRSGGGTGGDRTDYTRDGEVNLTVTPLSTLYLFGAWGFVQQAGQPTRRNERYSGTFSPFPDGTLRFNFFFGDEYRSQLNQRERVVSPSLRWNVTRMTTFDLSYSDISTSSDLSRTDTQVFSGNVRISF